MAAHVAVVTRQRLPLWLALTALGVLDRHFHPPDPDFSLAVIPMSLLVLGGVRVGLSGCRFNGRAEAAARVQNGSEKSLLLTVRILPVQSELLRISVFLYVFGTFRTLILVSDRFIAYSCRRKRGGAGRLRPDAARRR